MKKYYILIPKGWKSNQWNCPPGMHRFDFDTSKEEPNDYPRRISRKEYLAHKNNQK